MAVKMYVSQKVSVINGVFHPIGDTVEMEEQEAQVYLEHGFIIEKPHDATPDTEVK